MKMKINRPVGATRQRNTASIRRTVLYTAVVAAIGLFLAGLPVAGTAPAQAQAVQQQIKWQVNGDPLLYFRGNHVRLDSLTRGWNNNVGWGRLQGGGSGSDSYYTYAIPGDPVENRAEWHMRSRIGTQQISVYIPGSDSVRSTATVKYTVYIEGNPIQIHSVTVNQKTANQPNHKGWVNLLNPSTGQIGWVTNGGGVSVVVRDNEARPHYSEDYPNSRIGIVAVRMRCIDNCTGTTPPRPPSTTNPPPSSSGPRISGLNNMRIADLLPLEGFLRTPVGGTAEDIFQVSPSSAEVEATESVSGLEARISRSGASRTLIVTTNGFTAAGKHKIVITARDGSRPVTTRNVFVEVFKPKYRVERTGFLGRDKRLVAQRDFPTTDPSGRITWVRQNQRGGIVADEHNNLSHFDESWIAEGAKVWGKGVRVYDNALVKGNAQLRGSVQVYDNAKVYGTRSGNPTLEGTAHVFGNAQVSGNAQVAGDARVAGNTQVFSTFSNRRTQVFGNAQVFGKALIHSGAKVSGRAHVSDAVVSGALVRGWARVYGGAEVRKTRHDVDVFNRARICEDARVFGRDSKIRVFGDAQVSDSTLYRGDHGSGARYGDGCPDRTLPTPP